MMDAIDLVTLKLGLEFEVLPDGETLPPATRNAEAQPRLLVSRHRDGDVLFFRHDVPATTRELLRALGPERALTDADAVTDILAANAPVTGIYRIAWYTIERIPNTSEYPDAERRDGRHVIVRDGQVVAQAWSTCDGPQAAEVEVETDTAYRRRGFARQVVASWAAEVLGQGRAAFYSHVRANDASAGVARSLGLTWLSDEVEYL